MTISSHRTVGHKAQVLVLIACAAGVWKNPFADAFTAPSRPGARTRTSNFRPVVSQFAATGLPSFDTDPFEKTEAAVPLSKSTDPTPALVSMLQNGGLRPLSAFFALSALAMALTFSPMAASAARSGGRMGGSFSSAPTRMAAPSRSYSGGYSRGYSGGYRSGLTVSPTIVTPYYSPFFMPRPMFYGGPGVITYSRGPSFFDLLFFGGIAFAIANTFRNAAATESSGFWTDEATSTLGSGTSVAKISVALEVPNRDSSQSILSVLDRLAATARTDSRVGIQNLTSQVALELLRRKSSIVSASTSYKHFGDRTKAQRDFNGVAVKERSKFEHETVSRFGGVDYSEPSTAGSSGSADKATLAVVTLVLAIDGDSTKIPKVSSIRDVEDALSAIASGAKVDDCLQSAEILWTPQDRFETLSLRDVAADYPELRTV